MILFDGKLYQTSEQTRLLEEMEKRVTFTLAHGRLSPDTVIEAIDRLGRMLREGELDEFIVRSGLSELADRMKGSLSLLSREYLLHKMKTELGEGFFEPGETRAVAGLRGVRTLPMPLGTLFHIAAGNMEALPAYTVVEGLLTGNVNILKLPQADSGFTVTALAKLIEIEPSLTDYIYVFDTPSSDIAAMRKMAEMADGIVVWGGDAAVRSVRAMASPGVKLIEWGHRLSFAYISGGWSDQTRELSALAEHIIATEQLLCSSCQTIFIDTDSMEELEEFCRGFLPVLQKARDARPITDIGAAAEITLKRYTASLEAAMTGSAASSREFSGRMCGLTICEDSAPELSEMFGRPLVKRLPRERIPAELRAKKGYLQTAGLLCPAGERGALTELLIRCGVNRVTTAGHMSAGFSGESHDGEYSLRRYVRIANAEGAD